jgi:hypothetical protein
MQAGYGGGDRRLRACERRFLRGVAWVCGHRDRPDPSRAKDVPAATGAAGISLGTAARKGLCPCRRGNLSQRDDDDEAPKGGAIVGAPVRALAR